MATATKIPLASVTLSANTASVTFGSISQSYTDLIIIANAQMTTNSDALRVQFNGDTGSNYSGTQLYGDGSNALSNRQTSQTGFRLSNGAPNSGSAYGPSISHIMSYSNTTTYKSALSRTGNGSSGNPYSGAFVCLWRSTAAITSLLIYPENGGNILSGSKIDIYGVL